jgi:outer membrane lipoprotein-sorting protein
MKLFQLFLFTFLICISFFAGAQKENPANDPVASALMQKVSEKYQSYKNISALFTVLVQHPKLNPDEDDRKYVDTIKGQILLEKEKFKVSISKQQIFCDGKTIWTYSPADKEVQENDFQETDDIFSPSKIFNLYKEGYLYQIKEKRTENGKKLTVIEMASPNKKMTYFKIDIVIDEAGLQIVESKIYEKNGVRYLYRINQQNTNVNTTADSFTFDTKKHPGVKLIDLR